MLSDLCRIINIYILAMIAIHRQFSYQCVSSVIEHALKFYTFYLMLLNFPKPCIISVMSCTCNLHVYFLFTFALQYACIINELTAATYGKKI